MAASNLVLVMLAAISGDVAVMDGSDTPFTCVKVNASELNEFCTDVVPPRVCEVGDFEYVRSKTKFDAQRRSCKCFSLLVV